MIIGDFTRARGILDDVLEERKRQERLVAVGKFKETCASPHMIDSDRFLVLAEEYAEVTTLVTAKAFDREPPMDYRRKLRDELVQVAAVAVAWIEAIDQETT